MTPRLLTAQSGRCGRGAFSLVELLVVVGIIAVLLAVLLPVLAKANESARRSACLSNLRQAHVALALYAHQSRGYVPIGCKVFGTQPIFQYNYELYYATETQGRYRSLGLLVESQAVRDPRILYCPSDESLHYQYNLEQNPWAVGALGAGGRDVRVRAGYGSRPMLTGERPYLDTQPIGWAFPEPELPEVRPTLAKLKSRAVLADLVSAPDRLDMRHDKGVNVVYADGSGKWVPRAAFAGDLGACNPDFSTGDYNRPQENIWRIFDTY